MIPVIFGTVVAAASFYVLHVNLANSVPLSLCLAFQAGLGIALTTATSAKVKKRPIPFSQRLVGMGFNLLACASIYLILISFGDACSYSESVTLAFAMTSFLILGKAESDVLWRYGSESEDEATGLEQGYSSEEGGD